MEYLELFAARRKIIRKIELKKKWISGNKHVQKRYEIISEMLFYNKLKYCQFLKPQRDNEYEESNIEIDYTDVDKNLEYPMRPLILQ